MKRGYNPYFLPYWLRTIRFYLKGIIIPIAGFQLLRVIFVPTSWDFILLVFLLLLFYLFSKDII